MKLTLLRLLLGVIAIVTLTNANVRAVTPIQKHVHAATSVLPFVVAVVADHYTDQAEFDNDVDNFFEFGLLAHDYYDDHAAELDIYSFYAPLTAGQQSDYGFDVETRSQNCVISWSDDAGANGTLAKLLAVAGGVNPDRIVVIGDHQYNIGCTNGKWTYVGEDATGTDVLPHEMGHGLAGLKDEWFFESNRGVSHPGIPENETRNCFDPRPPGTTAPWAGSYPGSGLFAGCDFFELNAFHSHAANDNGHHYCLMGATHNAEFCPVCRRLMEEEFTLRNPEYENPGETDPGGTNPGERTPIPPPNQPASPGTRKPVPPSPPTGVRIVKTAFVQQPTPGAKPPTKEAPPTKAPTKEAPPAGGSTQKPVAPRPILQLIVSFDPTNGKIVAKKGFSITARYAPAHRRLGEWAYEIVNPTLKPEDRVVEVGVFPSNLFRSNTYQNGVAHQSSGAHATDVTIQIPDVPTDWAKTGTPELQIQIYRLGPNVIQKLITKEIFATLKSNGGAVPVGQPLSSKDIMGAM